MRIFATTLSGFWFDMAEAIRERDSPSFYLSEYTFDAVPISVGLLSEIEIATGTSIMSVLHEASSANYS
jgi:hypothetical protein